MIGVIITGHGCFAGGMYSAIRFLTGDSPQVIDLDLMDDSPEQLRERMACALEQLKSSGCKGIIILCDILGGTPFKTAATLTCGMDHVKVLYGANLAMAVDLCVGLDSDESAESAADRITRTGRSQIGIFHLEDVRGSEPENEDGGL